MYNADLPSRAELPSKRQLVRSTGIAMAIAAALLITVVLPAEYGLDPTGVGQTLGLTDMGKIKASLAAEAATDKLAAIKPSPAVAPAPSIVATAPPTASVTPVSTRTDEMSVTLKPGEATEVKMAMTKGAKVSYVWQVNGGLVNHDTHGDPLNGPPNAYHGYSKAKQVAGDSGELTAAFDGNHGWFWRNRGNTDVTVTLKTIGQYQSIKKMT
jgi:hypothetical protein